ncbi:MAG: thioredoxin domain-containing protein, partial [Planctomycetes bacterium]|nr:thioredoxin domain-containing protein [Planctomycetota bacterium]
MNVAHSSSRSLRTLVLVAGAALPVAAQGQPQVGAAQEPAAAAAVPGQPARAAGWRLADTASPYLRAHADNPVEWWPWGEEAFARARELDRPVFLSIGYSACHWCHRMEHDTFEDEQVARALNERFVCIKVDREERPDIDSRYLNALVLMTGGGGWPASLFLLPDGRPFFGGTYYPPRSGPQGPGLLDVLERLHEMWTQQRAMVEEAAAELHDVLSRDPLPAHGMGTSLELGALLGEAATHLAGGLDGERGGTHGAPKFPPVLTLQYLLRQHLRTGLSVGPLLEVSLDAMSSGGLCDHVGGGFFRYCVDDAWETPHFEKMLADNAQLATLYAEAAVALGQPRWADVARETLDFVRRELRLADGTFAGSLDADSTPAPGERAQEGRFYLWTPAEVEAVLGDFLGPAWARLHHVTAAGTFLDAGQPTGRSL